ncbi:hypothetical protein OBBRIDRAFT_340858 [Obba rivulosa]|uniref:Uncharacterized protein n=1 Tax=Obba rivulosa TaxID=1052685 RepID=A0A8E2DPD0_9APHY|nr:hypothetical protein OBBRIDRAFT_340858 [Obba rivulosa]
MPMQLGDMYQDARSHCLHLSHLCFVGWKLGISASAFGGAVRIHLPCTTPGSAAISEGPATHSHVKRAPRALHCMRHARTRECSAGSNESCEPSASALRREASRSRDKRNSAPQRKQASQGFPATQTMIRALGATRPISSHNDGCTRVRISSDGHIRPRR